MIIIKSMKLAHFDLLHSTDVKISYLERCKVNHTINVRVGNEDRPNGHLVRDVTLEEFGSLPRYQFDAVERDCRRVVQIVGQNDFVSRFEQR